MSEEFTFDPMTGEKIVKKAEPVAEEVSFDPMTGEKIVKKAEPVAEEVSFDPMTGEKITKAANQPSVGNDMKKGRQIPKVVCAIAICVVAVVLLAFAGISSGAFLKRSDKVLVAAGKTFSKASGFMELDKVYSTLNGNKYSVTGSCSYDDFRGEVSFNNYGKEKGLIFDVNADGEGVEANFLLTNNAIKASVPDLTDKVLYYGYTGKKSGYILEEIEEEDLKFIDNLLAYLYDNGAEEDAKKLAKDLLKVFRGLKFEKVSKESFEVNGKNRNCKGYSTVIGPEEMEEFAEVIKGYYDKRMEQWTKGFGSSDITDEFSEEFEDAYDEFLDDIDDFEDIEFVFYLCGGKLAAVCMEVDDDELEFQINNTKNPLEQMTVVYEDVEIEWEGDISGSTEEYTLRAGGTRLVEFEHDKKSGDVEVSIMGLLNMDGKVEKKAGTVTYSVDGTVDGERVSLELAVSKKTEKIKMDGDKFDIGNASEDDFEDLEDELDDIF